MSNRRIAYSTTARAQTGSPLVDEPATNRGDGDPLRPGLDAEQDLLGKGPLSGMVPGGGETTTTTAAPSGLFGSGGSNGGGLPGGLPGGGGGMPGLPGGGLMSQGDGQSQSPTLVLGGFSAILIPMRGMSMSNVMSMMSAGQQFGQMLPKPSGGSS